MTITSLDDPFDPNSDLDHGASCACTRCHAPGRAALRSTLATPEDVIDRAVESAIVRGIFGHHDADRRRFLRLVGGGTLTAAIAGVLPLDKVKAAVKEAG